MKTINKVIMVSSTIDREKELNELVEQLAKNTSIKAYPNVDHGAVFFPVDEFDLEFLREILSDQGFDFTIENAL
jgi:hypothetical protein